MDRKTAQGIRRIIADELEGERRKRALAYAQANRRERRAMRHLIDDPWLGPSAGELFAARWSLGWGQRIAMITEMVFYLAFAVLLVSAAGYAGCSAWKHLGRTNQEGEPTSVRP